MLGGVAEACDEAGVALVLIPFSKHAELDSPNDNDVVRSAVVDGFVAHCDALDPRRRVIVEERRLPIVVLDGRSVAGEPSVGIDEEGGAAAAARHLLELGHTDLAVIRFAPHAEGLGNVVVERRLAGYRSAVADAGHDPDDLTIVDGFPYDRSLTADVLLGLLGRPDRPTAVLAMSDEMAVATIDAARHLGLHVPTDLSVVGFDDTAAAQSSSPALTTVRQPHAAKGAAAVRMLLDEPGQERHIEFPVELVVRASTAPPAQRRAAVAS